MKFRRSSIDYKQRRADLSQQLGQREIWDTIDHFPLYVGVQTLARFVALESILRSTLYVPGHVAEFGTYRGGSLMLLAKLLRIWDPMSPKEVHGFDSFEGLTEFSDQDVHDTDGAYAFTGQFKGSLEELRRLIALDGLEDEVPLHVGLIEETLPAYLAEQPAASFSFVMCDTDLYQSTRLILDCMHPRLMSGGVFVLDEWNAETFPGEGVATQEFLAEHGDDYSVEHVYQARQPTLVLRKN